MKIAYCVPYVPNLIRTRPYNLIVRLASLGHEVEVFTLGSNRPDLIDAQNLKVKCKDVHFHIQPVWHSLLNSAAAVPTGWPLQTVYSWQCGMARKLADRVGRKEFDVVHVEHLRGSRYGTYIKSRFPNVPVVWDSVDCISHLFEQAAEQSQSFFGKFVTRFELPRTRRAEGQLICRFDHVLVTSAADKSALLELAPEGRESSPISIVPNGVDLDYFHPNPGIRRDDATIVFSGKMSYHANVSMAKYLVSEIMPRVWKEAPEARLIIVGKDPSADVRNFQQDPRITVTGTVEDIRPFLWRATISIVPLLYGAGIQNKILEAMATATPVITTPRTLSALQVQSGRDILVANDPNEFGRKILWVIRDKNLGYAIGGSGLSYVRNHHNWNSVASRVVQIYQRAMNKTERVL